MDGYSISQVAERTGFTPSALRFYEQAGLVRPDRAANGYRSYDDRHVELLRFVGRAKELGLRLDEITELLTLLEGDRCEPVQARLQELVTAKIDDAQTRIGALVAFTAELQRFTADLGVHTPDGPCDPSCGCTGSPAAVEVVPVPLTAGPPSPDDAPPIVCSLAADDIAERVAEWQHMLAGAGSRQEIDGGVRVRFSRAVDVERLARLAIAEQQCCAFFTFVLRIDGSGVALDVTGPPAAEPVITALVGAA